MRAIPIWRQKQTKSVAHLNVRPTTPHTMRPIANYLCAALLILASGCTDSQWHPDTAWHTEQVTEPTSSFLGSYQNALDTLRVRTNAWKLIGLHQRTNQCEWGFKVVIEFPDHLDYKPDTFGGVAFMPITKIEYQLFDTDGFHLTTLILEGKDLGVAAKESRTFQNTGMLPVAAARRAAHGKLNVQAGYVPKPSKSE